MSKHSRFGGCQGTEGEIAHTFNISKNTPGVNTLTHSQCNISFSVWSFVLNILGVPLNALTNLLTSK